LPALSSLEPKRNLISLPILNGALFDIGYDGYVTAELLPFVPGRPEKTAQAMKKIFK